MNLIMNRNIKFLAFLIVFMSQCTLMLADNANAVGVQIDFYRKVPPLNGNPRPSRAPAKRVVVPISAFLNESNRCLSVFSTSVENAYYYVYDEEEQEVSSGIVTFSRDAGSAINLGMLLDGEYTIEVIIDGVAYEGTFYL